MVRTYVTCTCNVAYGYMYICTNLRILPKTHKITKITKITKTWNFMILHEKTCKKHEKCWFWDFHVMQSFSCAGTLSWSAELYLPFWMYPLVSISVFGVQNHCFWWFWVSLVLQGGTSIPIGFPRGGIQTCEICVLGSQNPQNLENGSGGYLSPGMGFGTYPSNAVIRWRGVFVHIWVPHVWTWYPHLETVY